MKEAFQFFRRVNLRHFMQRRLRTALTVSGVAAGVALIFSISVINATLVSTVRSSIRLLGGEAELEVAATDLTGLPQKTIERVASTEGVERAIPAVRTVSRITGADGLSHRGLWLGVTLDFPTLFPSDLGELTNIHLEGGSGVVTGEAILAQGFADAVGVDRGDEIRIQTPRGPAAIKVSGILSGGALETVNGGDFGLLALPVAQELFNKQGRVDSIYVVTDPETTVADVDGHLEDALGGSALVGPPGERAEVFERTFMTLQLLTSMAGVVALFVALFVVYNTMSMSVTERRREISLGLALGIRRRPLFGAFLSEAAALGILASIIGICGGLLLARALVANAIEGYRFVLPETTNGVVTVPSSSIVFALVCGIAISVFGAFVPVRRVLTVAPIEFLRPQAPLDSDETFRTGLIHRVAFVVSVIATFAGMAVYASTRNQVVAAGTLISMLGAVTLALPWTVPLGIAIVRTVLSRFFGTVGRLAGDALRRNVRRTIATTAALLLSLAMVVGVGTAIESLEAQLARSAEGWFGAPLYVTSTSYNGFGSDQPLPNDMAERIQELDGVASVYPGRYSFVNVAGEQTVIYAVAVAQAAEDGSTTNLSAPGIDQEAFIGALGDGKVVVSRYTARRLELEEGDAIEIPTPTGRRSFTVGGQYDDLVPFDSMYLEHSEYVRFWKDSATDRFALIPDEDVSEALVASNVADFLRAEKLPAEVQTREEVIGSIGDISEGLVSIARGIQLAALIVAALTIANTMFIAVLERRWEFGLEQALGMGRAQLGRTVLLEAAGIGFIGAGGGALLGVLFGWVMLLMMEQQFAWRIPFEPQLALTTVAVVGGVLIAAASAIYPRRLAARLPIIECLRYE